MGAKTEFLNFSLPQTASTYRKSDSKAVPLAVTAVFTGYVGTLSDTTNELLDL